MRRAVAAAGLSLGLAASSGCGPEIPVPDGIGIYVAREGALIRLPKEHTESYVLNPWVKLAEPHPTVVIHRPGLAIGGVRLVKVHPDGSCGTEGRCSQDVAFHMEPLRERIYALRPDAPLEPDVYALVLKQGPRRDEVAALQVLEPAGLTLEAALAKHLEAVGRARLDSLRVTGETTIQPGGLAASARYTFQIECARPHSIRYEVQTLVDSVIGYDGERAWRKRGSAGEVEWLPPEDGESSRRQALECLNRGLLGYRDLELLGRDSRDGRSRLVVGATHAGERVNAYLDAESFLLVGADGWRVEGSGEQPWTRRYSQFTEFDGVTVPRATLFLAGRSATSTGIATFEPNVSIAPARFRRP